MIRSNFSIPAYRLVPVHPGEVVPFFRPYTHTRLVFDTCSARAYSAVQGGMLSEVVRNDFSDWWFRSRAISVSPRSPQQASHLGVELNTPHRLSKRRNQ